MSHSFHVAAISGGDHYITTLEIDEYRIKTTDLEKRVRSMIMILEGKLYFAGHLERKIERARKLITKLKDKPDLIRELETAIINAETKRAVPTAKVTDQRWFDSLAP